MPRRCPLPSRTGTGRSMSASMAAASLMVASSILRRRSLRTALAMGVDRAILVRSEVPVETLAVAKLLARIAVQLRGPRGEEVPCLAFEDLMLDPATRQVTVGGVPVHLTRTEYALCHLLLQNPGRVLSKSAILERISRDTPDCTEGSLKQHMSNLRKKLRAAGGREYLEAVWGIGFQWKKES